jgi:NTP pyrophosphatase (non-canonical NTP hydrolase)
MREQLTEDQIVKAVDRTTCKLASRLAEKGYGTFASSHEILGILREEYIELESAIHQNDYNEIEEELTDIAVGAIFGLACLQEKTVDW